MTAPAITGLKWTRNADGSVTATWDHDADPDFSGSYLIVLDGGNPVSQPGTSFGPIAGNVAYTIVVSPVMTAPQTVSGTYTPTPPPPPTKQSPKLLLDRGGPPPAAYRSSGAFGGYVVSDGLQGEIPMSNLFPTSDGKLATSNAIDKAILELIGWNKANPKLPQVAKIRLAMGFHLPAWMMSLAGAPITVTDPTSGHSGQVARFWVPNSPLWTAIDECLMTLGAKYDGVAELGEFLASRNTTAYNEPCIRQITDPSSVNSLRNAGYNETGNLAAFAHDFALLPVAFPTSRVGVAFNPEQVVSATGVSVSEPTTESLMRQWWASSPRASVENCSLRSNSMGTDYDSMYALMGSKSGVPAGKHLVGIQTATAQKVGNLASVIQFAGQKCGADHVELPATYENLLTPAQCVTAAAYLAANA